MYYAPAPLKKNNKAITDWDKGVLIIPDPIGEKKVVLIIIPAQCTQIEKCV